MVQFSQHIKDVIKELADKGCDKGELIPYQMEIDNSGFIQDIPAGLGPYKLDPKQIHALLGLIHIHNDVIFSGTENQCSDDEGNNYSFIEFTRFTFHFYLVYDGLPELHHVMGEWKNKGVGIFAVSVKNNKCTGR